MTEDHPFNNRTTYGATKIANEQMLRAMYEQHKLPYIGLRYMNIYGPRMDYEGTYVSVIMKVLDRDLCRRAPRRLRRWHADLRLRLRRRRRRAPTCSRMQADCADEFFNVGMGSAPASTSW